tara:strand:+ start:574 stop:720 length:147 start_codon:yes stop_codon:yes gene_type:complete
MLGFVRKLPALANTALKINSCPSPIKMFIYTRKFARESDPFFVDFCLI